MHIDHMIGDPKPQK